MSRLELATLHSGIVERHLVSAIHLLRHFAGSTDQQVAIATELRAAADGCGDVPHLRLDGVRAVLELIRTMWLGKEARALFERHRGKDAENQVRTLLWVVRHHQGDPLTTRPLEPGEKRWTPAKEAPPDDNDDDRRRPRTEAPRT